MKKTTNGFANLTLPQFRSQVSVIVSAMTGNLNFPTLQSEVTALSAPADAYYALDNKAETRDKNMIIDRNAARIQLTTMLHEIGFGVTAVSKGNEKMLSSSGFTITKDPQKSSPLQQPAPPKVSLGANKGTVKVKAKKQKGGVAFNYYNAPAPTGGQALEDVQWEVVSHNAGIYHYSNLISGQPYLMKVGLVGVRGQEVISEPITIIPQ